MSLLPLMKIPNRRKLAWLVIGGIIIVGLATAEQSKTPSSFLGLTAGDPAVREKQVEGTGQAKIVVLPIEGIIQETPSYDLAGAQSGVVSERQVLQMIDIAQNDADVKAMIMVVNSPGGSVTASQTILEKLQEFRRSGKKLVTLMREVAASGGYYIAADSDVIVANGSTITGSIGVIMHINNLEGLYTKLGYKVTTFKSGKFKDIGSPTRPISDEEQTIFQTILDEEYNRFIDAVAEGRKMDRAKIASLGDGRIYSGHQAKNVGLVDEIGNMSTAIAAAKKTAGLDEARIIEYRSSGIDLRNILGGLVGPSATTQLLGRINQLMPLSEGVMYLWQP